MASIKVNFRLAPGTAGEGYIYYRISHQRKVCQITTEYRIRADEWDRRHGTVAVAQTHDNIRADMERLSRIDRRLAAVRMTYTADDVADEFRRYARDYTLFAYMRAIIEQLRRNGKVRTSETYRSALESFRKFLALDTCPRRDIMLDCITSEVMERYQAWQCARGISPNTISFYNRILRAVYNRAADSDIIDNRNPFRHVYTGVEKTRKRALPITAIKRIGNLDLSDNPTLDYARDMFMLSFFFRGMSFVDMAFLRKADLRDGYITYRRRKTGQMLTIRWTREMHAILAKYPENSSKYLLPIIRNTGINERYAYRNAGYNINRALKRIAAMAGLTIPLTLYVARHSWASAARAKGIPLSVISEGMGHDSEATTRIYLASLDTSVVDKANSLIIRSLR